MRRALPVISSAICVLAVSTTLEASATTNISSKAGTWQALSLIQNGGIGYRMVLTKTSTPGTYSATLRMTYGNGSQGDTARGTVRFSSDGTVTAQLGGGSVMGSGRMSGLTLDSGGVAFDGCEKTLVDAHYAPETMCTFARVVQ